MVGIKFILRPFRCDMNMHILVPSEREEREILFSKDTVDG